MRAPQWRAGTAVMVIDEASAIGWLGLAVFRDDVESLSVPAHAEALGDSTSLADCHHRKDSTRSKPTFRTRSSTPSGTIAMGGRTRRLRMVRQMARREGTLR